jgi:hypothetical protein
VAEIPIYNVPSAQQQVSVPTSGIEALAGAARRLGSFGNETAAMIRQSGQDIDKGLKGVELAGQQLQQHQETSDQLSLYAAHAAVLNGLEAKRGEFMAAQPPGDLGAAQRFQEQFVQPAIDQLTENAQTEKGRLEATRLGATLGEHFSQVNNQEQARLSHAQVGNDISAVRQSLSGFVQQNPDSLPAALDTLNGLYNRVIGSHPGVAPEVYQKDLAKDRQEFTVLAAKGLIDRSIQTGQPFDVGAFFKAHGSDLGGQGQEALTTYQLAKQKLHDEQERTNQTQVEKFQKDAYNDAASKLMVSTLNGPNGTIQMPADYFTKSIPELAQMPGNTPEKTRMLYDFGKSMQEQMAKGVPDVTADTVRNDFNARLFRAPDDPTRLTDTDVFKAKIEHSLSDRDFKFYQEGVAKRDSGDGAHEDYNKVATAFQNGVKQQLNPSTGLGGFANPAGASSYARWLGDAIPAVRQLMSGGMNPTQAWTTVTSDDFLKKYKTTPGGDTLHGVSTPTPKTERPPLTSIFGGAFGGSK